MCEAALWADVGSMNSKAALPLFWPAGVVVNKNELREVEWGRLLTFSEDGEVDFNDSAVQAKDGVEVSFYDVASEVVDDDDLCIGLVDGRTVVNIHVGVDIGARRI